MPDRAPRLAAAAAAAFLAAAGTVAAQEPNRLPNLAFPATAPALRSPAPQATASPLRRQIELSARAGADWLCRSNGPDGRFVPGQIPALRARWEGDHFLRQAGAAFGLARAAALPRSAPVPAGDRCAAIARQAVLTLLLETETDPRDPSCRFTSSPHGAVNRLASAGLLVLAVNELPAPADDLIEQSEQLCRFIAKQQRPDGSLAYLADSQAVVPAAACEADDVAAGQALYGLARSLRHRPLDEWKSAVLIRAAPTYRARWAAHRGLASTPWLVAAFAEAFEATHDPACAAFAREAADWLTDFQYVQLTPQHPLWQGGFMACRDGRPAPAEPTAAGALYAEALAQAYRVARDAGDVARCGRYRAAIERHLQFLALLQYNEANTQHFADWYRPALVGGVHASPQDGNLRVDDTAYAVAVMCLYLAEVNA